MPVRASDGEHSVGDQPVSPASEGAVAAKQHRSRRFSPVVTLQAELACAFARWTAAVRGALEELRNHRVLCPDADPAAFARRLLATPHGGTLIARVAQCAAPGHGATDAMLAYITPVCRAEPLPRSGT